MSSTKDRRKALKQILLQGRGGTQLELCDLLSERGFRTTQSTVSRDLKLLGAERRLRDDGTFIYRLEPAGRATFPAEMVLAVEHNECVVVVKTRVGRAPAVAVEIDALRHPDVLGTVAGDDTVIIHPRSTARVGMLAAALGELAELLD